MTYVFLITDILWTSNLSHGSLQKLTIFSLWNKLISENPSCVFLFQIFNVSMQLAFCTRIKISQFFDNVYAWLCSRRFKSWRVISSEMTCRDVKAGQTITARIPSPRVYEKFGGVKSSLDSLENNSDTVRPSHFYYFFQQFFILICNSRKRMSAPNEILYLSSSFMSVCCSSELPFREKYENYVSFENKSVCLLYRSPSSVQYLLFSLQNCEKSQKVHIQSTAV